MSVSYDKLVPALKTLLADDVLTALGRTVAFIRRLREIRADIFVWSVVLSRFGAGRPGFERARHWYQRLGGAKLWPRPFQMRFKSAAGVRLFEHAFERAVQRWRVPVMRRHPLARHFADVALVDSTVMQVSDELRKVFKGTRSAAASLKALLTISAFGLVPLHAKLVSGHVHDMKLFPILSLFRPTTLLLFDKGFVAYERLAQIAAASLNFLCPMRLNGNATIVGIRRAPKRVRRLLRQGPDGIRLRQVLPIGKRVGKTWDLDVILESGDFKGHRSNQTRCRLVIVPGPKQAQRPYLTTLHPKLFSPRALGELYRLRWQIELVFKELKQHLSLDALPSKDHYALQIFAWASLLALALSRTVSLWLCPLPNLVGLRPNVRPMLVTRALQGCIQLLARALTAAARLALAAVKWLADEILCQVKSRDLDRQDSFKRLIPLLRPA
jgi:hypothetical protein